LAVQVDLAHQFKPFKRNVPHIPRQHQTVSASRTKGAQIGCDLSVVQAGYPFDLNQLDTRQ
jgi:hypothetical protein